MFIIKTELKYSTIHGIGCFAGEDIKKGQLIWQLDEGIDLIFDEKEFLKFPAPFQNFLKIYAYCPIEEKEKKYILCVDHARHMNHSDTPSVLETPDGKNTAARDIKAGEELTCDYNKFDQEGSSKLSK